MTEENVMKNENIQDEKNMSNYCNEESKVQDKNIENDVETKINEVNDELKQDFQQLYLELLKKYEAKEKEANDYLDMLRRNMADFDNYRKRTNKEKESMYDDGIIDAVKNLLPVLDNLERALEYNNESESLIEGIKMIVKLFKDTIAKMNIQEINALGEKFNPEYHNAVMHVEDENYGENEVVEVLQKGYKYKDKILRYSMVKVAN
ncbi:nucleotide exchange factor GrpE [Caloramator sp. E03]|uniref:nucleotide exchange factor GrpE n=1 Tax=Caloramator sp. E03 TaxID=2576307 RepID=UPI001FAA9A3C|nr:nucleotide exchange factor GrpE [Caloramator sp. E03]